MNFDDEELGRVNYSDDHDVEESKKRPDFCISKECIYPKCRCEDDFVDAHGAI